MHGALRERKKRTEIMREWAVDGILKGDVALEYGGATVGLGIEKSNQVRQEIQREQLELGVGRNFDRTGVE